MRASIIAPIREDEPMRLWRITAVVVALLGGPLFLDDAHAQQCPKGKLRLYTSWPMQGAMIPEGTGMKNGVAPARSEVDGVVAGPWRAGREVGQASRRQEGLHPQRPGALRQRDR